MNGMDIYKGLGGLDADIILKATPDTEKQRKNNRIRLVSVAACICLMLAAGISLVIKFCFPVSSYHEYLRKYISFEQTLAEATDVVIAEYKGFREAEDDFMLYKFSVYDRIYGNAPDEIEVSISKPILKTIENDNDVQYSTVDIGFEKGTEYILVLERGDRNIVYKKTVPYLLLNEIIINTEDFSKSSMYCKPINEHTEGITFSDELTKADLISYIHEKTKNNVRELSPTQSYIDSDDIDTIVSESPDIIKVKINKLNYTTRTAIFDTDFYWCTVEEVLKGDLSVGQTVGVIFFADTVRQGKEYIVAVNVINEKSDNTKVCYFTSKNNLYGLKEYDRIKKIIAE